MIFEDHGLQDVVSADQILDFERAYSRTVGPNSVIDLVEAFNDVPVLDITGSFQFHTSTILKYRYLINRYFVFSDRAREILKLIREYIDGRSLVALHWREGDYNDFNNMHPYFWKPNPDFLISAIGRAQSALPGPQLFYVATDNIATTEKLLDSYGIEALFSQNFCRTNFDEQLAWDFLFLTQCDAFISSNSSFSACAALFNHQSKLFFRALSPASSFYVFNPWYADVTIDQYATTCEHHRIF
jgi:hypothetical protein